MNIHERCYMHPNAERQLAILIRINYLLTKLLFKVNRITAAHIHGNKVRKEDLDLLSDRQIEVEEERKLLIEEFARRNYRE